MPSNYDKSNPLMMSAEILLGIEQAAGELDFDITSSLEAADLTRRQISSGKGFLPLHKVVALLNDVAETSGYENFGLLIAKHQPPARFAMIGQLARFSDNLGMAIQDATQFSLLNSEFTIWETVIEGDTVALVRNTRANFDAPMFQMRTLAIAVVYKAINAICQRRIALRQVNFALAPPAKSDAFEHFFGAPVVFNHTESSLVMPLSAMAIPVPTADPAVRALLLQHLARLANEQLAFSTLDERVRNYIQRTVGSRHCHLDGLCAAWGVHPRAIQRSLKEIGTSFREVLLGVRQELAEQYLRDSSISVAELSDILGYANPSAFSRAFKHMSGTAPDIWRASQKDTTAVGK